MSYSDGTSWRLYAYGKEFNLDFKKINIKKSHLLRTAHVATLNGVGFVKLNGIVIAWEHIGLVNFESKKICKIYFR